jgi:hypothetical protein
MFWIIQGRKGMSTLDRRGVHPMGLIILLGSIFTYHQGVYLIENFLPLHGNAKNFP